MSDAFWANLPASLTAFFVGLPVIGGLILQVINARKAERAHTALKEGQDAIKQDTGLLPVIKKATDGMTTKMVESAHKEGEAEGKAQEQAQPTTVSVPIAEGSANEK